MNISHLEIRGDFQGELALVSRDSRKCDEHTVFAAIRGEKNDGHDFVPNAYAHGARAFIVEKECGLPCDCTQIIVENSRKALAEAALFFAGHPEKKMRFVAVTGTKGKSTTAAMIYKILSYSGIDACLIGTNGLKYKNLEYNTENSTPDITVTARFLGESAAHGCKIAVIEASSQGIKQNRLFGLDFDLGIMTNLSADHIGKGEHPDFEDYENSKMKLFESCKTAIFNTDDERCAELCERENHKTFGIFSPADAHAD
ncbi:MAG: UDP-N-acetylmuramoyl-L-alanyl-D-glutamate--2,6-diaminopimelate ligase, partial [Clostridiales bacterium]|nr:UDP-N-acetylmuramoyl-L-alanyl-D-glutamate--2,6-diaminopimelate ligase [Clostridiales bacterium]